MFEEEEVTRYRKKSHSRGQSRSKHKHVYKTVLLTTKLEFLNVNTGKPILHTHDAPTKVCQICGRISYVDYNSIYYEESEQLNVPYIKHSPLSQVALELPRWEAHFLDKIATRKGEC